MPRVGNDHECLPATSKGRNSAEACEEVKECEEKHNAEYFKHFAKEAQRKRNMEAKRAKVAEQASATADAALLMTMGLNSAPDSPSIETLERVRQEALARELERIIMQIDLEQDRERKEREANRDVFIKLRGATLKADSRVAPRSSSRSS